MSVNHRIYTVAKVGKEKNGDHLFSEHIKEKSLLVAMVADGVSQQPTDWLASEMACQGFIESFNQFQHLDLAKRIEESIYASNQKVISTATKMASTLAVLVYEVDKAKIHYASIGDSRIYKLGSKKLECLTEDDAELQSRLISSNRKTFAEKRTILNQVIGQDGIKVKVESTGVNDEILILVSDGFYNARPASFTKRMLDLYEASDFDEAFDKMVDQFSMLRGDDLSIIAINPK